MAQEHSIKVRFDQVGNLQQKLKETQTATKALTEDTKKLAAETQRYSKAQQDFARQQGRNQSMMPAGPTGRPRGAPAAGTDRFKAPKSMPESGGAAGVAGAMGFGAMAPAAIVGLITAAIMKGMDKAAEALEIAAKSTFSESRKQRELAESVFDVTGIGSKVRRFNEAALADPIRGENERSFAINSAGIEARMELEKRSAGQSFDRNRLAAASQAVDANGRVIFRGGDRSTFQGGIAYENAQRRNLAANVGVDADRRLGAASAIDRAQGERLGIAGQGLDAAVRARDKAAARIEELRRLEGVSGEEWAASKGRSGRGVRALMGLDATFGGGNARAAIQKSDLDTAIKAKQTADLNVQAALAKFEDESLRKQKTKVELIEAESQKRKAVVEAGKAELDVLKAQEARLAQQNVSLGGQNKGQRMSGLAAARFLKQNGLDMATPEIVAAAEGFAPDFVRKQKEQFAEGTDEVRAGKAEGFLEQGVLNDVRAKLDKVQADVQVQIGLDEKVLAKAMAEQMGEVFARFAGTFMTEFKAKIAAVETGLLEGQNK